MVTPFPLALLLEQFLDTLREISGGGFLDCGDGDADLFLKTGLAEDA